MHTSCPSHQGPVIWCISISFYLISCHLPVTHCVPVTLASSHLLNWPSSFLPSGFFRRCFLCLEYPSSTTFHGGLLLDTQVSAKGLTSQKSVGWLPVSSGVRLPTVYSFPCLPPASHQLMGSWEQGLCLSSYHHILTQRMCHPEQRLPQSSCSMHIY